MSAPDRYTCEDVFRKLDDFVDRALSDEEIRLVQAHIDTCARCMSEVVFEESVLRSVRDKVQRVQAPPGLLGRIMGRIKDGGA